MRLPRDVSGSDLAARLRRYGYEITRQTGSHLRLTTTLNGEHHLTIPRHADLRLGTLHAILREVADHQGITLEALVQALWG
jgi:predicted RNA binding protein YcfA (HicA-like mRNA interferase family)